MKVLSRNILSLYFLTFISCSDELIISAIGDNYGCIFLCCMIYLTGCGILDKMLNKFYVFYVKTLEILPLTLGELSG